MFDPPERSRPQPAPTKGSSRRSRVLIITAAVLVGGFVLLTIFSSFWTERLWYRSTGYAGVFSTLIWTRVGLFLVFGGLMAATVALTINLAYRFRPLMWPTAPGSPSDGLDRYRQVVTPMFGWLTGGISLLMGLFAGASASGQWRSFSLWRNAQEFGTDDPYFGKDAGFYVFDLPWWHFVVDFTMALAVIGLMATLVVHYLFGGIRLSAPAGQRFTGAAQVQISVLLAVFVLAKAADYWLDRYDLVHSPGGIFTGIGYTEDKAVLPAKEILTGIAIVCAILFLANIWRRTWLLPSLGVALFALSAIILGLVVPGVVQQLQVSPNVPDKEGRYIKANIDATRAAYQLDGVDVQAYGANAPAKATSGQLDDIDGVTDSVPLVDPQVVTEIFEQQQQVRAYYSVSDVLDVDRYEIDGNDRALVLGVRELDQSGLAANDQNWSNLHTVYTHGNGVIAAYANHRPKDNSRQTVDIQWAEGQESDESALTELSPDGYETRVYFGEKSPTYSIVGKDPDGAQVELDLPKGDRSDENQTTSYDGDAGVEIGNPFDKLLYAVKFGEINLILSDRVHENSKIIYDRDPRQMVEKVAPWLTVDSDPYPAVVDGKIKWILDGYTVTDRYPLSQRESLQEMTDDSLRDENAAFQTLPTDEINYLRNSVKATVDAYDGTVSLYAWDEDDPILKAWEGVFPDVVQDRDEIPEALMEHLRYPEDLFKAQRYQFQRYHVTEAQDWFEGSTRWEVPKDPESKNRVQPPYRLFSDVGEGENWSLTSVYVPREKDNLAAFMSVNSDATQMDDYGRITVLELPNERTDGPRLIANTLSTNEDVSSALLPYTAGDAKPVFGNLLTLPVGDSFMYVQPLYTQRQSESAFPILRFVLVSYNGRVGIGTTLRKAIADSLGVEDGGSSEPSEPSEPTEPTEPETEPTEPTEPETELPQGTQAQIRALLTEAEDLFLEADKAQSNGNTVRWAKLMEQAREKIEQAVKLSEG